MQMTTTISDQPGPATLSPDEFAQLDFAQLEFDELDEWLGEQTFTHGTALIKLGIFKFLKMKRMQGDPIPLALNMLALDIQNRLPEIAQQVVVEKVMREMNRSQIDVLGRFKVTNFIKPQLITSGSDPDGQCHVANICWQVKTHFEHRWVLSTEFEDGFELCTGTEDPIDRLGSPPWRKWKFVKENKLAIALNTHRSAITAFSANHGQPISHEATLHAHQQYIHKTWKRYIEHVLDRGVFQRVSL